MRNRIFTLFTFAAFVMSAVGFVFVGEKASARGNNELVGLLPASDIVINLDAQRLFNTALPQIFSADPGALTKINAKLDELKDKTGLDLRQFQHVSAGIAAKRVSPKKVDFEPFIIARGTFNSGALLAVAKLTSKGKYQEKRIGSRTVYIFTPKEVIEANKPKVKSSMLDIVLSKIAKSLSREIALSAYDSNTLVIGSEARLREAFEKKTTVSTEVLSMVYQNPNAVINFGGKFPNGLAGLIDIDNDEIGNNIQSIRQMSGALTVENNQTQLEFTAKTLKEEQAQGLHEMLQGLQILGKAFLGNSKKTKDQIYVRMIESAEISRSGSQILFDLKVPQSDIDVLLGKK